LRILPDLFLLVKLFTTNFAEPLKNFFAQLGPAMSVGVHELQ